MRIAWERLDEPGLECLDLSIGPTGIRAEGRYVGVAEGTPAAAGYTILLDASWRVQRVACSWGLGAERASRELSDWDLAGYDDVDLAWTPFTNTLPIRRLRLQPGESRDIRVAWIQPGLQLVEGLQRYTRLDPNTWRFESLTSGFTAELSVDDDGLVIDYPGLFRRIARQGD